MATFMRIPVAQRKKDLKIFHAHDTQFYHLEIGNLRLEYIECDILYDYYFVRCR